MLALRDYKFWITTLTGTITRRKSHIQTDSFFEVAETAIYKRSL